MRIDILTVLPGLVEGPLGHSILRRAAKKGLVDIRVHDIRDYSTDKHRQVDDYPFGGGAGMVLKPEPIFACLERLMAEADTVEAPIDEVIYLSPDGEAPEIPVNRKIFQYKIKARALSDGPYTLN